MCFFWTHHSFHCLIISMRPFYYVVSQLRIFLCSLPFLFDLLVITSLHSLCMYYYSFSSARWSLSSLLIVAYFKAYLSYVLLFLFFPVLFPILPLIYHLSFLPAVLIRCFSLILPVLFAFPSSILAFSFASISFDFLRWVLVLIISKDSPHLSCASFFVLTSFYMLFFSFFPIALSNILFFLCDSSVSFL